MTNTKTEINIFLIIAIVATIPAIISKYFPAVDSPSHLEIANVLSHLITNPQEDFFSQYFQINSTLIHTNWLFYLLPTALIGYLPAFIIEKIIVYLYIVTFILIAQSFSKLYPNQTNLPGFLLIPLIYNFALHSGFYSFLFGLELSFLTIAYYLYYQERWQPSNTIIFFFLFNLIYLLHPFTFAMTLVILYPYSLYPKVMENFLTEKNKIHFISKTITTIGKNSTILLYALPGILCLLLTLLDFDTITSNYETDTLNQLLKILGGFYFLWSFDILEIILGAILFLSVVGIFIFALRKKFKKYQVANQDGLIFSLLICLILFFISPDNFAHGGNLNTRITPYLYFLMVIWLGYQTYTLNFKQLIKFFAVSIFSILLIFNSFKSIQISDFMEEYTSIAPYIKENSTMISYNFIDRGLNYNDKMITNRRGIGHVTGYIAIAKNGINLGNFQATRKNFPIKFRPEISPEKLLTTSPPEIMQYNLETPGRVDYIILWGASYPKNPDFLMSILQQLEGNYQLIYSSKKRNLAQLYQRIRN